jgi:hypothetical protein
MLGDFFSNSSGHPGDESIEARGRKHGCHVIMSTAKLPNDKMSTSDIATRQNVDFQFVTIKMSHRLLMYTNLT